MLNLTALSTRRRWRIPALVIFAVAIYLGIARDLRSEMDSSLEQVALKVVDHGSRGRPRLDMDALPPGYAATLYDPVGNAKRITCIFHAWSFDTKGNCTDISREEQGFQKRFCKADAGLRNIVEHDSVEQLAFQLLAGVS